MADPYIGAPAIFFFVEATVPQPEVTTPATVALGFTGTDGTSGAPQFSFKDDAGTEYHLVAFSVAATGNKTIPYEGDGMYYPSILRMSSDLLYMILDGNLWLGDETGTGAINRSIFFPTGAGLGYITLGAGGATNDSLSHDHYLPQTDIAAPMQVIGVSNDNPGTHQWDFMTADVCLARGVSVDLNSTTKQTLYTVPTGRDCIITKIVIRNASAAVTTANGGFGWDAGGSSVIAHFDIFNHLIGTGVYAIKEPDATSPVKGASTSVLGFKATTPEGSARTMVVDVFGYLL